MLRWDKAQMLTGAVQSYGGLALSVPSFCAECTVLPWEGAWQGHSHCSGCAAASTTARCKTNAEAIFGLFFFIKVKSPLQISFS